MSAIFVSHASADDGIAADLRLWLTERGHRAVFLDHDADGGIAAGQGWEREVYRQLRACGAVVALCSPAFGESRWCLFEVTVARFLGKPLLPVLIGGGALDALLADTQAVDLAEGRDRAWERLERGLRAAGLDAARSHHWDDARPPYPGLMALQEQDAAVFFGREDDTLALVERIRTLDRIGGERMIAVLGASGSGKSSLVRAGLLPRLRQDPDRWVPVEPFRPRSDPEGHLADALAATLRRLGVEADASRWSARLAEGSETDRAGALREALLEVRRAADRPGATVVLVIDQLEELLGLPGHGSQLTGALRAFLADRACPALVVATLRSDFLGTLQTDPDLGGVPLSSFALGQLPRAAFREVIEGPARLAAIELEPGLTEALVDDASQDDALPLLAFTLRALYERIGADRRLTVAAYRDQLGGLEGSIRRAAEEVLATRRLSPAEERGLRVAFTALVRVNEDGGYARRAAPWSSLPAVARDVLERFVGARLLVSDGDAQDRRLEVAHEAIFRAWNRLVGWLDEDRAFLLWRRRVDEAIETWSAAGRSDEALLTGVALSEAEGWLQRKGDDLGEARARFVRDSVALARRRRRRSLVAVSGVALATTLLAAVAGGLWLDSREKAVALAASERRAQAAATTADDRRREAEEATVKALAAEEKARRGQRAAFDLLVETFNEAATIPFDRTSLQGDTRRILHGLLRRLQGSGFRGVLLIEAHLGRWCVIDGPDGPRLPGRPIPIDRCALYPGTPEYALAVAQRQAADLRRYIQSLGLEGIDVRVLSYGYERPRVADPTKGTSVEWNEAAAQNNRLELRPEGSPDWE